MVKLLGIGGGRIPDARLLHCTISAMIVASGGQGKVFLLQRSNLGSIT
jgi:hypothetical protein